ncbi:ACT domain-containing protein [Bradyrhizobium sp. 5.13L]|jgi:uncharacterized protein
MAGELDLNALLKNMNPDLYPDLFVFCTVPHDERLPADIRPLLTFREHEGTTLVTRREDAERAGLRYTFTSRLITLTVHSALDAVGFLAAVTSRLANAGISVNAVSAFYHDHLLVPADRADEAMAVLQEMAKARSA